MRGVWCWTTVGLLLSTSSLSAGEGEEVAADQLPPTVSSRIKEFGAVPLHARKEVEGGKACYVVTAKERGRDIEIYASPDGSALARKAEPFSLAGWVYQLVGGLVLLLPGLVAGAAVRELVRAARGWSLSVPAGWLAAWAGATTGTALLVFNLATVPRDKDVPVLTSYCLLWGAIAASAIQVVVLATSRDGVGRRWWVACVLVTAVSLALTIPLSLLSIERENRYWKKLTMRPVEG